jgi:hypothetical protein
MLAQFLLTITLLDPQGRQVIVIHEHPTYEACSGELAATREGFKVAQKGYVLRWADCSEVSREKAGTSVSARRKARV